MTSLAEKVPDPWARQYSLGSSYANKIVFKCR